MKKGILVLISLIIGYFGTAFAAPDYLKASSSEVSPSVSARIGQPIAANMLLKGFTPYPEEASLNISSDVDRPRIEVIIDGKYEVYGLPRLQIQLPSEGVKDIEIRLSGFAPPVTKLTTINVLDVKTLVRFKGENETLQEDGTLTLVVSDREIIQTVTAIDDARDKYNAVRSMITGLAGRGINTVELEAELDDIKVQIELAENAHEKGDVTSAQKNAEIALNNLDRLEEKIKQMGVGPAPTDIKRYLTIGGAVIVALLIILFIKGRREELG